MKKGVFGFVISLIVFWLMISWFLPITQDEAYYYLWSKRLAWGYFDHPPAVAFYSYPMWPKGYSGQIWGAFILACCTLMVFLLLLKQVDSKGEDSSIVAALCFTFGSLAGLLLAPITTPDCGLMFAWTFALHEGYAAISKNPKRWLSCGLATGLALLSKYTALLLGPIFLLTLAFTCREQLRKPWVYLGGLVAFCIFLPNLIWNQQHHWQTFQFQLRHGFSVTQNRAQVGDFPPKREIQPEDHFAQMIQPFKNQEQLTKEASSAESGIGAPEFAGPKMWKYSSQFWSGQLSLLGAQIIPLCLLLFSVVKERRRENKKRFFAWPRKAEVALLVNATILPLVVFGFIALFSKVESNWAVMSFIAGGVLVYTNANRVALRYFIGGALFNALIVGTLVIHAQSEKPFLPLKPKQDRIKKETSGYPELAQYLKSGRAIPIFAETYQLVAMIQTYDPQSSIQQWPGLTRASDFIHLSHFKLNGEVYPSEFRLVLNQFPPPLFEGYSLKKLFYLSDCQTGELRVWDGSSVKPSELPCLVNYHRWYLAEYQKFS